MPSDRSIPLDSSSAPAAAPCRRRQLSSLLYILLIALRPLVYSRYRIRLTAASAATLSLSRASHNRVDPGRGWRPKASSRVRRVPTPSRYTPSPLQRRKALPNLQTFPSHCLLLAHAQSCAGKLLAVAAVCPQASSPSSLALHKLARKVLCPSPAAPPDAAARGRYTNDNKLSRS